MEPILNLSPQEFRAALAELQLDPAREAMLVEQYNAANAPQQGGRDRGMLRNLLDNIIGFDDEVVTPGERLGAGAEQFASGLLSDPLGMVGDIAQGGYETIERAMAPGATPMDVMGAAGMAMLPAGLARGVANAVPRGPNADFGQNFEQMFHYTRSPNRFSEFDVNADQDRLGPHVGTLQAAIDRRSSFPQGMETGEIMDLRADLSRPFLNPTTNRPLNETQLRNLISDVADEYGIERSEAAEFIRQRMAGEGYTNIAYINDVEDPGSVSNIMLTDRPDGSDAVLRRADAAFDPSRRTDPNLLAANRSATVGLLASAASDTPAQRVARLLREGRADEVTDDLMAQADPQEMFRLYEAGETGMDLPMDEASRMARAREMGRNTPAYHSTDTNISAVDNDRLIGGQFWSTDDVDAINRGEVGAAGRGVVLPLQIRQQNPAGWRQYDQLGVDELMGRGYDGLRLPESDGTNTFVTFDPEQVRSRFARFDPRLSHLSNLNAANVDPLTGAVAVSASQQDDPLANLRAYIAAAGGVLPR